MDNEGDKIDPPLTKEEQAELKKIEKFLANARNISPKVKKHIVHLKDKKRNYDSITTRLEEVLDAYILIGFDNGGNDYVIIKSTSPMDNLALNALVEHFVDGNFSSLSPNQLNNKPAPNDDDYDDEDD